MRGGWGERGEWGGGKRNRKRKDKERKKKEWRGEKRKKHTLQG